MAQYLVTGAAGLIEGLSRRNYSHRGNRCAASMTSLRDVGVRCVLYAGFSAAYGGTLALPKREDMLPQPMPPMLSPGWIASAIWEYSRVHGLEMVVLRYFNVFGGGGDDDNDCVGKSGRGPTERSST